MPDPSPYSIYLRHLRAGELAYQFSAAGQKPVFFPRTVSPYDHTESLAWRVSRGLGTVYSTTTIYPRDQAPYNVAVVDCDEGFRLMTRVEQCPAADVRIGMRVKFEVHTPPDGNDPYPIFIPASESGAIS